MTKLYKNVIIKSLQKGGPGMDQDILNLFSDFDHFRGTETEYAKFRLFFEEAKRCQDQLIERYGKKFEDLSLWEIDGIDEIVSNMLHNYEKTGVDTGFRVRHAKILFDIFGEEYVWGKLELWRSNVILDSIITRVLKNDNNSSDCLEVQQIYESWLRFVGSH